MGAPATVRIHHYNIIYCLLDVGCDVDNGDCEHNCNYTNNGTDHECSCNEGYEIYNSRFCRGMFNKIFKMMYNCLFLDANECKDGEPCGGTCVNTIGSYQCDCSSGYILDSDEYTCIGM